MGIIEKRDFYVLLSIHSAEQYDYVTEVWSALPKGPLRNKFHKHERS